MDRAALTPKASPKLFHHTVGLDERLVQAADARGIVRVVLRVLCERDTWVNFIRLSVNSDVDVHLFQRVGDAAVEVRNGHRSELDLLGSSVARGEQEPMVNEIEVDSDGLVHAPMTPGIGAEIDFDLIEAKKVEVLR